MTTIVVLFLRHWRNAERTRIQVGGSSAEAASSKCQVSKKD